MRDKTTSIKPFLTLASVSSNDGEVRTSSLKSRSRRSDKCELDTAKSLDLNLEEISGIPFVTEKICSSSDEQLYSLEDGCSKKVVRNNRCADRIQVKIPVRTGCTPSPECKVFESNAQNYRKTCRYNNGEILFI